jgi:hypothetical protein
VVKIDYQPWESLRTSFKYAAWGQPNDVVLGSLPGFNDTQMNNPVVPLWAASVNYSVNSTTFLEATFGHTQSTQAGCALTGGGANFCTPGFRELRREPRETGSWGCRRCFLMRRSSAELLPRRAQHARRSTGMGPAAAAQLSWGPRGQCSAQQQLSRVRQQHVDRRSSISLTKLAGGID